MSNDLKPLKHYINNREKMLQEAFLSIQDTQLQKLIPASLKQLHLEELKAECLVQLLGMSKKRILCVLEGRTLESSSSESEPGETDEMQYKESKEIVKDRTTSYEMSDESSNLDNSNNDGVKRTKFKQEKTEVEDRRNKKNKSQNTKTKVNKIKENSDTKGNKKLPDDSQGKDGKTLLEILELEMRAKAIRALLRQVEGEEDSDNTKEERGSTTTTAPATTTVITQDEIDLTIDDDLRNSQGESNSSIKEGRDNSTERDEEEIKSVGDPSETEEMGWAGRWLKSKDVKRVVATSKMITSVRKKMKTIHKSKNVDKGKHSGIDIEGSVNEYRMLSKDHSQQRK